jgi:membrane protein implicated in regulation of membrane protease activity
MGLLLFLLILILLAAAGVLGFIIKVAFAVALGVFLGIALIGAVVAWRVRRFFLGPRPPRWRRPRGSHIEVLDHRDRW